MNRALYTTLTDDTLAALANKGLLRRAQKDLETASPTVQEERPDALVLHFAGEGCTVTLPAAGPAKATCTCPADTCCRHILAGALFLRATAEQAPDAPTEAGEAAPQPDELLALTEVQLVAWAGRTLYRQTVDELAFGEMEVVAEIQEQTPLFRLPTYGQTVRLLAGAGLDGVICSCKQRPTCKHAVAAILFYQAQHGTQLPIPPEKLREARAGTPRTRQEVLESVQTTLAEMVALGLGRLAKTTENRLTTLAISAHGVDVPNLEYSLRGLGDHLAWHLNRDVRANTPQLLSAAARTYALAYALCQAKGAPSGMLVGEHRLRYFDIGNLELVGVGAGQWRTRAGYIGLTLYFWDVAAHRWTSWTDARPTIHGDVAFNPRQRYSQEEMWDSAPAPAIISRSRFRLSHAQRNRKGRLSGRTQCQALLTGAADLAALNLESARYDDWYKLAEYAASSRASGLVKSQPMESLVIVTPAAWGEPIYDQMRQVLVRPLLDAAGRILPVVLPYSAEWPFAVDTLQAWNPAEWETWGILGTALIGSTGLELAPISLLNRQTLPRPINSQVLHLTLDAWQAPKTIVPAPAGPAVSAPNDSPPQPGEATSDELREEAEAALEAEEEEEESPADENSAIGQLLRTASTELEQLAERGARAGSPALEGRLRDLAERLRQIGLASCATALTAVAQHLEASRHQLTPETERIAQALLRAYYLLHLAAEQVAVTETLAGYQG